MSVAISPQNYAESDQFLISCFYDAGFIRDLTENNYTIISGRKGTGKTAIAKYLQEKAYDYNIDFVNKISLSEIDLNSMDIEDHLKVILFYILTESVRIYFKRRSFHVKDKDFLV